MAHESRAAVFVLETRAWRHLVGEHGRIARSHNGENGFWWRLRFILQGSDLTIRGIEALLDFQEPAVFDQDSSHGKLGSFA